MQRQRGDYGAADVESPAVDVSATASESESAQSMAFSARQWPLRGSPAKLSPFAIPDPSAGESPLNSLGGMQAWVCALSALSGFVFGYDLCVMVIALPLIQEDFGLSTAYAESVISTLMVGAVVGSLGGGVMADWIGRKPANLVTAVLFLVGSVLMTIAPSVATLLAGRFVAGLAVGSSGPCVSVYVAEIAHPDVRGTLVTINEVMVCVGCVVSIAVGGALEDTEDGWRKILAITAIPPLLQLAGIPLLPESPRWLLSHYQAQESLIYSDEVDRRIISTHSSLRQSLWDTVREIITDEGARSRVLFCMAIAFCHILTGANAMLYYSTYIIGELRANESDPQSKQSTEMWIGVAKLAGVCSAILIVDRVGRRPLLLVEWNLYAFIFMWNLSWSPLMWVVCSEVLPDEFRSVGMGLTFAVFWMGSALVNQTLLSVFAAIGPASTFLLYSVLTACSLGFVSAKVPETMGLSFEQIAQLFSSGRQQQAYRRICSVRSEHTSF